jgi:hypothetical protein
MYNGAIDLIRIIMAYCSKCGYELKHSAIFCVNCGTRANHVLDAQQTISVSPVQEAYTFEKNWASAWVLIGSILSPFRELQILFGVLGYFLGYKEIEKYESRKHIYSEMNTEKLKGYLTKQAIVIAIHLISIIVASYFFLVENPL